ncbi:MBL fold metallo-hydrolase [Ilumatobacter nonamiensis]|uniref:MBL fold metallo-hydrolase n=1 Tax=Ilumatobacter nonamiensis TaxID=467093 RepID=UPI0003471BC6|nr:MBL fold metallo-hydrolase [Ilumatobacter nonamiensis]
MSDHAHPPEHHHHGDAPSTVRPPKQEQEDASTEITEVAPGILRSQLPISMPGLGHVNCYLLEDERGLAVVDPGLPGDESWDALGDRLGRAGFKVADVHTIVVTHSHPDHFGGAIRLRYETDADIVTHETFRTMWQEAELDDEEDSATLDVNSVDDRAAALERYFSRPNPWGGARSGPPPEFLERMRAAGESMGGAFAVPSPTRPLTDGQTIKLARREWVAMHTPGHTYDHLCLLDPEHGVVLTGDHVLPSITPHISGMSPQSDPLAEFFASLIRMEELHDVTIALPAHGHPFEDLGGRARHIIEHHEDRLDIIRDAQEQLPNGTVDDFMRVLFRERSWGEMAESETYAHLEHLRELGELSRSDTGGFAHYAPTG